MDEKRHILICGERGVGKSTLIEKLITAYALPVYGFVTRRAKTPDADGFYPVYIFCAGERDSACAAGLVGRCGARTHTLDTDVFDTLGVAFIREARPGGVIVMDELGFMEAGAEEFTRAVLDALDGDIPVIAAVKQRYDIPFLNAVRAHPNAQRCDITKENRDDLFDMLCKRRLG